MTSPIPRLAVLKLSGLMILALLCSDAWAQCPQNITVKSKTSASPGKRDGQIRIEITASGAFDLKLLSYRNINRTVREEITGSGNQEITFRNLSSEDYYRIEITFHTEQEGMCRTRVINDIQLTADSQ